MYNQLTSEQRYAIYLGIKRKIPKRKIARAIEVHPSTVLREIRRNSNANGAYVWRNAQQKSESRKHGLKGNHRKPQELWWRIDQMIIENDWSPGQIAGVLRKEGVHIVKQTIYNHVHADTTGICPTSLDTQRESRRCVLQKRPTLPTAQASTSVRWRLMTSGLATGRWIPLSTPSGTPSSRLQSAPPTSSSWKSSSKAERRCRRQRRWLGCCSLTVNVS